MPLYFAYASNMDVEAMRVRCPRSQALGRARLMRHRFALMREGYATVATDPRAIVHGVLWELALSDVRTLDTFESTDSRLYKKIIQPVFREGGVSARALVYVGRAGSPAKTLPGYMEGVIAAARAWELPQAYIRELEGFRAGASRASSPMAQTRALRPVVRAERDETGNVKVRARFASPHDRGGT